jgi:SNF family Na+-dependent transporter
MYSVRALRKLPKDTSNYMEPTGSILLLPNSYRGLDASFSCFLSKPICSKVERNRILAWLPLSTSTLVTSHLSMCTIITIASVCGKDKSLISSSLKVIGTCNHLVLVIGPLTAT